MYDLVLSGIVPGKISANAIEYALFGVAFRRLPRPDAVLRRRFWGASIRDDVPFLDGTTRDDLTSVSLDLSLHEPRSTTGFSRGFI